MGAACLVENIIITETPENINVQYIKSGNTTVEVVSYFPSKRTYDDVIRDALRREFAEFAD